MMRPQNAMKETARLDSVADRKAGCAGSETRIKLM